VPFNPGSSRAAMIAWVLAAAAGTVAVWYLSSYLEGLADLAHADPEAARAQFKSRALPALLVVVGIAVAAGAMLMRQGLQIVNQARDGEPIPEISRGRGNASAKTVGAVLAGAGFVLAAVPLVLISLVLWMLTRS
jgi:hypothetical protein